MSLSVWSLILLGIIAAGIYYYIPVKYRAIYLTGVSLSVYFLWAGIYAFIVLCTELTLSVFFIHKINRANCKTGWLTAGICVIVIFLAFHKYKDFWIADNNVISRILMPLGISYYSFKMISYMADMYRSPQKELVITEYLSYVTFFPQIICGPISRANELNGCLNKRTSEEDVKRGAYLILQGLFYKAVIADKLSPYTDSVFASYDSHAFLSLWMAAFFYSIELYCDFAGYSYIVSGICRLMGINISDNFRLPYYSASIREFWTRWHISLSSWLKDYIYIPLGGSRRGKIRRVINIFAVFIVSGLWHGNTIVYLIWGLWHGVWNVLSPSKIRRKVGRFFGIILTDIIVMFGWIAFKIDNLSGLRTFIADMFKPAKLSISLIVEAVMPFTNDYASVSMLLAIMLLVAVLFTLEWRNYRGYKENITIRAMIYTFAVVFFGVIGQSGFIYANY